MTQLDFYIYLRQGLRLYEKETMPIAQKYGLTYMEFVILMFLANNSAYNKASDIVTVLGIAKSHVSLTLDQLEKKGLVERTKDITDKRSSVLIVLKKAEEIISDGRKAQEEFRKIVIKDMTEEELQGLNKSLMKLEKNVKENL
ncbi:MAG: MarR family winged helix-turn-helix transcriptional regulator [Candidatus Ornithospirochaeta sp.]